MRGRCRTCAVGAKMATTEACQSSLGKESDWIRGTARKIQEIDWLEGGPSAAHRSWGSSLVILKKLLVLPKPG